MNRKSTGDLAVSIILGIGKLLILRLRLLIVQARLLGLPHAEEIAETEAIIAKMEAEGYP